MWKIMVFGILESEGMSGLRENGWKFLGKVRNELWKAEKLYIGMLWIDSLIDLWC